MRWRLLVVPAVAGMFLLGACGDDSGSSTTGGAEPAAAGGAVTTAAATGGAYSGGYAIPPDVSDQAAAARLHRGRHSRREGHRLQPDHDHREEG